MTEDTWLVRVRVSDDNLWPVRKALGYWDGVRLICFLLRGLVGKAFLLRPLLWAGVRTWPSKAVTRAQYLEVKGISEGGQQRRHVPVTVTESDSRICL